MERSRTPVSASCKVRGIGVAVSVSTCTSDAQRLELLLVGDTEMLLLVDHQQRQILELDALAEQRVRADHDIDARRPPGRLSLCPVLPSAPVATLAPR